MLGRLLANECGSQQCRAEERRAILQTVLNRMARRATTNVADVCRYYVGCRSPNPKLVPTAEDFALAEEFLRTGIGNPKGPTHFISVLSLRAASLPAPGPKADYFKYDWSPGYGIRWTPNWVLTGMRAECPGCRWDYVQLYYAQ